jgi:hypothetical protein
MRLRTRVAVCLSRVIVTVTTSFTTLTVSTTISNSIMGVPLSQEAPSLILRLAGPSTGKAGLVTTLSPNSAIDARNCCTVL